MVLDQFIESLGNDPIVKHIRGAAQADCNCGDHESAYDICRMFITDYILNHKLSKK